MKVEYISNILNKKILNFNSNTGVKVKPLENDSFKKEDVQYNFTYNNVSSSTLKAKSILKGQTVIKGVSYGKDYILNIDKKKNIVNITGKIGEDDVKITSKRRNNWGNIFEIDGQVGDKKLSLIKKRGFIVDKRLIGNFDNEPINITIQHFRHDDIITGPGVDMKLMHYTDINSKPKYVGTYELSPEFLPVIAGLTRYM